MIQKPRVFICKTLPLLLAIIFTSGCVTIYNPATQRRESLLLDTPEEVSMGRDMDQELRKKLKIISDQYYQMRLERIGLKVAAASDRQDLSHHFAVVKDKELNAFAIPGGYIYVNSGLMDAATDDELACVLAHEAGHVAARHSVKKLQAALGYQLIVGLALGLSGKQSAMPALDVAFNLINLGYSRQDEFLADRLAVRYASRAGYNPQGLVSFFEKLKAEAERRGENFNLVYFSSHPPIEERIKQARNEISAIAQNH